MGENTLSTLVVVWSLNSRSWKSSSGSSVVPSPKSDSVPLGSGLVAWIVADSALACCLAETSCNDLAGRIRLDKGTSLGLAKSLVL